MLTYVTHRYLNIYGSTSDLLVLPLEVAKWICKVMKEGEQTLFDRVRDVLGSVILVDGENPNYLEQLFERGSVCYQNKKDLKIQAMVYLGSESHVRQLIAGEKTVKSGRQASAAQRDERLHKRLKIAAFRGYGSLVRLLIESEPRFHQESRKTMRFLCTIIRHAALGGHSDIFNLALDICERPEMVAADGCYWNEFFNELAQASKIVAHSKDYERIVDIFGSHHLVFSKQFDGDVLARIEASAYWGRTEMVRYFLQQPGVRPEASTDMYLVYFDKPPKMETRMIYRPLISAIESGSSDIVKMLLEHGADPNTCPVKETALMIAVTKGVLGIVRLLVEHGADVNVGSPPPIVLAMVQEDADTFHYLREKGATFVDPAMAELALRTASFFGLESAWKWLVKAGIEEDKVLCQQFLPRKYDTDRYPLLLDHRDCDDPLPSHSSAFNTSDDTTINNWYMVRRTEIGNFEAQSRDSMSPEWRGHGVSDVCCFPEPQNDNKVLYYYDSTTHLTRHVSGNE